mmetsp:Transcript_167479/g.532417  ORF Transcript_167479/g.532417 Transcript_167479/m.532417 type:complete len:268 (+) Transcript_167479:82-885(+)
MAMCPGDTTEWDDIQRKFGNFAPKPKVIPQRVIEKALQEAAEKVDAMDHLRLHELTQLEDAVEEDTLVAYRNKRMAEFKKAQGAAKFGEVLRVIRTTFVREVTETSANGQWVLCLLYVDSSSACQTIFRPWEEAAKRFPAVKFMKGVATEVVENFPDSSTPAILVYRDEDCVKQIIGLDEWGGSRCSADCIEWVLSKEGIVDTDMDEDPRPASDAAAGGSSSAQGAFKRAEPKRRGGGDDEDSASEDERKNERDDRCYQSTRIGRRF